PGDWHSADSLAMALAVQPAGALELAERPLAVETGHGPAGGATVVDWSRASGRPDNAVILTAEEQARLDALVPRRPGLRATAAGLAGVGGAPAGGGDRPRAGRRRHRGGLVPGRRPPRQRGDPDGL